MANIKDIAAIADAVVKEYSSRDPYEIAEKEGVRVCSYDLGSLNGMYVVISNVEFIALSSALSGGEERLVCAHELGHHYLHRELAQTSALADSSLYSGGGRLEYEANAFAAELLITDREMLEVIKDCPDLEKAATELGQLPELVAVKCEILRERGLNLRPLEIESGFLKRNLQKSD